MSMPSFQILCIITLFAKSLQVKSYMSCFLDICEHSSLKHQYNIQVVFVISFDLNSMLLAWFLPSPPSIYMLHHVLSNLHWWICWKIYFITNIHWHLLLPSLFVRRTSLHKHGQFLVRPSTLFTSVFWTRHWGKISNHSTHLLRY